MADPKTTAGQLVDNAIQLFAKDRIKEAHTEIQKALAILLQQQDAYQTYFNEIQFASWYYQAIHLSYEIHRLLKLNQIESASFVSRFISTIPVLPPHNLMLMRLALQIHYKVGNYATSVQLLQKIATMPDLTDKESLGKMFDKCTAEQLSEKFPFNQEQKLCHSTFQPTLDYDYCGICGATFLVDKHPTCTFCSFPLTRGLSSQNQNSSKKDKSKKTGDKLSVPGSQGKDGLKTSRERKKKEKAKKSTEKIRVSPQTIVESTGGLKKSKSRNTQEDSPQTPPSEEPETPPIVPVKPSEPEDPNHKGTGRLLDRSDVMTPEIFSRLKLFLPLRLRQQNWKKLFSTEIHGVSWITFYNRIVSKPKQSKETMVLIKDSNGDSLGCFATEDWVVKEGYFGTGECFVFKAHPTFKCWTWNDRFADFWQICTKDYFGMGANALTVYEGMAEGTTSVSTTFRNELLSRTEQFSILVVEVWCFVF